MQNHRTFEKLQIPCLFALLFLLTACGETDAGEPAPSDESDGVPLPPPEVLQQPHFGAKMTTK